MRYVRRPPSVGFYGRQTCLNGHVVTSYLGKPFGDVRAQNYCSRCGAETITACPSCGESQRGYSLSAAYADKAKPDAHCHNCGKPYPWTARHLVAAEEMVREDELLSDADKSQLTSTFVDLTSENPRTTLAATRFKRIISKAGKAVGEAIQKTIVDVASETAKKIILGG
jgi:hypothetical protein